MYKQYLSCIDWIFTNKEFLIDKFLVLAVTVKMITLNIINIADFKHPINNWRWNSKRLEMSDVWDNLKQVG